MKKWFSVTERRSCKLLFVELVKCPINTNSSNDWNQVSCHPGWGWEGGGRDAVVRKAFVHRAFCTPGAS